MTQPKKLIEVAMPIKEISAESVRDKSIRHGHISTLHLWWARRPLPVCRAVVFASLVPDPLDPNCPEAFKEAIRLLLGDKDKPKTKDPYATYADIPWTSVFDPMDDNLRNRLQMFIGKFTNDMQQHLLGHAVKPDAGKQLSNDSLIKWDNKNNENIINIARKLIFVSYQAAQYPHDSAEKLLRDFDFLYNNIKTAEQKLYALTDRHLDTEGVAVAEKNYTMPLKPSSIVCQRSLTPLQGAARFRWKRRGLVAVVLAMTSILWRILFRKAVWNFRRNLGNPLRIPQQNLLNCMG